MDSSEIERLFDESLLGDYDSDIAWEPVHTLRGNGNREIFDRAALWCRSDNPLKRARGADILCQLRPPQKDKSHSYTTPLYCEESFGIVSAMLSNELDVTVLNSGIFALGHLGIVAAIPGILRHLSHPNEDVRFAVACALGHFPNDSDSVTGLLTLMRDRDGDVRDWATFGLGVQGNADSPEIREALLRCLTDTDEDVREEAAVGLGKRREPRLLPVIRQMLKEPDLKVRVAEAAAALLGLELDPPEWEAQDYLAALDQQFPS